MSVIEHIRDLQRNRTQSDLNKKQKHEPEIMLIGCVDARLSPNEDIGIPQGKAIIKRNIAALIAPFDDDRIGETAALEFAADVMKVKDIVVMGHTDCGGIRACLRENAKYKALVRYLKPLEVARDKVKEEGGNIEAQATIMEQEAVRQSLANLMTYPNVKKAVEEGRIKLHGWVIDTASKRISELNQTTMKFELISSR